MIVVWPQVSYHNITTVMTNTTVITNTPICFTMRGKSSKVTECTIVNRGIATGSLKLYWVAGFRVEN